MDIGIDGEIGQTKKSKFSRPMREGRADYGVA